MTRFWLATRTLWTREIVRFYRDRSRVIGALAPPVVFWFLIGAGLSGSFHVPGQSNDTSFLQFFFPGTILLIVLFTAIFSTISIIEDRREGFLQAVLVAPVPRSGIVLGKILGGATLAFLQGLTFLILAPTVGLSLHPKAIAFVLAEIGLISIGLTGLGFWIAWRMDSSQGFHAIMNLFLMPLWFLSGALFPVSGAPAWLRWIMKANPVTYAAAALQQGLLPTTNSAHLPGPWTCLGITGIFVVLIFVASVVEARRSGTS